MLQSFVDHIRGKTDTRMEDILEKVPIHHHVLRVVFIAILFVVGFRFWDKYFNTPFDHVLINVGAVLFCLFVIGHFVIAKVKEKLNERSKLH